MPSRLIREGWLESEPVNQLDAAAERFFLRLCLRADDFGRYHANPMLLRSALFPLRDDIKAADVTKWLDACCKAGLTRRYSADGKAFVEIPKFGQRMRAAVSKFPQPADKCPTDDGQMTGTCQTDDGHVPDSCGQMLPESETESESEAKSDAEAEKEARPFSSLAFEKAWAEFKTHRKQIRKPITPLAAEKQLKQLAAMGEQRAIEAIEHTIAKGWQGIREPDGKHRPDARPDAWMDHIRRREAKEREQAEREANEAKAAQLCADLLEGEPAA